MHSHDWNAFVLFGGIFIKMKKIILTKGKFAFVDDQDYDLLNKFKWQAFKHGRTYYAVRTGLKSEGEMWKRSIRMHRFILGMHFTDKTEIDHIDSNGLNNTRVNLRKVTDIQNKCNVSAFGKIKYKGVSFNSNGKNFRARIQINHKPTFLGYYETETQAAEAYNIAAIKLHGEYAKLNNI